MARVTLTGVLDGDDAPTSIAKWNGMVADANNNFDEQYVVPGLYNGHNGLRRWRLGLGKVGKSPQTGTGLGGVDVVCYGDSLTEGGIASAALFTAWPHLLKLRLQARFNPSGVLGGYGYIPTLMGQGGTNWPGSHVGDYGVEAVAGYPSNFRLFDSTGAASNAFSGSASNGLKALQGWVDNGKRAMIALDGTDPQAAWKRLGADRLEIVAVNNNGSNFGAPSNIDVFTDQASGYLPQTAGTGAYTKAYTTIKEANVQWARRYALDDGAGTMLALDASARNLVQVTGPTGTYCTMEGIIAYNGDYDCGVRLHNCAHWGTTVEDSVGNTAGHPGYLESMDVWGCDGGNDANGHARKGAVRAKLGIFNWVTNSLASVTLSNYVSAVAAFKTAYATQLDRFLALPSQPCALLWIPPLKATSDTDLVATIWPAFKQAIHDLADERAEVAVLDVEEYLGYGVNIERADAVLYLGGYSDGLHWYDPFHVVIAEAIYRALAA